MEKSILNQIIFCFSPIVQHLYDSFLLCLLNGPVRLNSHFTHISQRKKLLTTLFIKKSWRKHYCCLFPRTSQFSPISPIYRLTPLRCWCRQQSMTEKKRFTPGADFHLCIFKPKAIWFEKSFLGTWSNAMLYNFSSYLVAFSVDGTCVLNWIIHRISKVGEIYTYFRDFVWDRQNCDTFLRQNCNTFLSGWRNLSRNRNQLSKLYSPFYRFKYRRSVWKSIFSGGEVSEEIKPYVVGKKSKT